VIIAVNNKKATYSPNGGEGGFLTPKSALTANKTTLVLTHWAHSFMVISTKKLFINSTVLGTLEGVIYGQRIT